MCRYNKKKNRAPARCTVKRRKRELMTVPMTVFNDKLNSL